MSDADFNPSLSNGVINRIIELKTNISAPGMAQKTNKMKVINLYFQDSFINLCKKKLITQSLLMEKIYL